MTVWLFAALKSVCSGFYSEMTGCCFRKKKNRKFVLFLGVLAFSTHFTVCFCEISKSGIQAPSLLLHKATRQMRNYKVPWLAKFQVTLGETDTWRDFSNLNITLNISPPSRLASQRFFKTATFRASQANEAWRLVWTARPIPSRTIRSALRSLIAVINAWSINLKNASDIDVLQDSFQLLVRGETTKFCQWPLTWASGYFGWDWRTANFLSSLNIALNIYIYARGDNSPSRESLPHGK